MSQDIPSFLSDKNDIISFDYNQIDTFLDSDINHYKFIPNLSVPDTSGKLCKHYFQSIISGKNHIFIDTIMEQLNTQSNICLPLLHKWLSSKTETIVTIDNLVIINHPEDAERICNNHIKKAPIFKSFLYNSIISTTDNQEWLEQRDTMNMAFIPKMSLKKVFPISEKRAQLGCDLLKKLSHNYTKSVNINEYFLNETQSQLQLGMFGFSDEFEQRTNKKIRDAFAGIDTGYTDQYSYEALEETQKSYGPLSKIFDINENEYKNKGNLLILAFAGHDTTAHTLTWLLYELCKHPHYKQQFIQEIDTYWNNHTKPSYDSLHELPFMTKCIIETLRLWPALANGTYRELEHDEIIHGIDNNPVKIKKGTYCQIINWTRHRNKDLWGTDANQFNPNRQFKDSEIWSYKGYGTTNISSERFSPFTYGPRNCIGKNFSHMEMRLILLHLFKEYDFKLSYNQKNSKVHGINLFTMGPNSIQSDELLGMYVDIIPRKSRL